jgi:hypothetical protein
MGVTHQAVYNWRKRGWVPPERATYGMTENVNDPLNYKPDPSPLAHQETTS